jgi:hypothetical protein
MAKLLVTNDSFDHMDGALRHGFGGRKTDYNRNLLQGDSAILARRSSLGTLTPPPLRNR